MRPEDRIAQRRLAWFRHVEEVTHNVAKTCRYYGISRTCYYRWYSRYQEVGFDGLRDRSARPHVSPRATPWDVVEKVFYLRRCYHFPHRIQMYLHRYHGIHLSAATIWRFLKQAGMNRLPSNMRYRRRKERYRRYEKLLPGHQLQVDVKFLAPLRGHRRRYYQYTAIDDCTRIRVLKIYDRNNQKVAIAFVDEVPSRLPFQVECIQTDNGSEFGPSSTST